MLLDPGTRVLYALDAEIGNAVGANDDSVNFSFVKQAVIQIQLIAHLLRCHAGMAGKIIVVSRFPMGIGGLAPEPKTVAKCFHIRLLFILRTVKMPK